MKVAFKASSFKNSSYHVPTASYIQAKELRKDLKENTQGLAVTHQEERIRCPILSSPTRIKQICVSLLTPHLHSPLLLQLGGRFYLEGILLGKVQNQGPPLSSGIGSIKHLGREHTRQMNGDREMKSHQGGPKVGQCSQAAESGEMGEEAGEAYRNLPTVVREIRLHILQRHQSTLSAERAEESARGLGRGQA